VWGVAIALVVIASLVPAFLLPQVPAGGDKLEHFTAYGLLAVVAVQLFGTRDALIRAGLGLIALGIALEFAQGIFTTTRAMDAFDALANSLGVMVGLLTVFGRWRNALLTFDWRY
jgi:VanZ family protein